MICYNSENSLVSFYWSLKLFTQALNWLWEPKISFPFISSLSFNDFSMIFPVNINMDEVSLYIFLIKFLKMLIETIFYAIKLTASLNFMPFELMTWSPLLIVGRFLINSSTLVRVNICISNLFDAALDEVLIDLLEICSFKVSARSINCYGESKMEIRRLNSCQRFNLLLHMRNYFSSHSVECSQTRFDAYIFLFTFTFVLHQFRFPRNGNHQIMNQPVSGVWGWHAFVHFFLSLSTTLIEYNDFCSHNKP